MDIKIAFTHDDLEKSRCKRPTRSKTVLASVEAHESIKAFAEKKGVSIKVLMECIAAGLPNNQSGDRE